jgi:hypothetical protein
MRQHYVAVVRKEADSDFRAFFPDFSCVFASAPTLAEAIKKAGQALAFNATASSTSLAVGLSAQPAKSSRATVSTGSQAAMSHIATFR